MFPVIGTCKQRHAGMRQCGVTVKLRLKGLVKGGWLIKMFL